MKWLDERAKLSGWLLFPYKKPIKKHQRQMKKNCSFEWGT